ncbi:hypothetical protein [Rhodococcus zopfii]|uniref:hypothetical protein n=1 Tax=Rhodococcus zopfii TaxID=43772 RepID=UPI000B2C1C8C|nr:hypothetical protein [Rhodococcus zopfii]
MCYPVTCPNCGKTGWDGCGQHVDAVMRSVPAADRCTCGQDTTAQSWNSTVSSIFRN